MEVESGVREKQWELMGGILVLGWDAVVGVCRTAIGLWIWQRNNEPVKGGARKRRGCWVGC